MPDEEKTNTGEPVPAAREQKKERVFWLDCARSIAIVSISCNHALEMSFTAADVAGLSAFASFLRALFWVFSRVGVPFFLMISGALLLGRDYEDKNTLRRFLRHNWLDMLITTEIWITLTYWYLSISDSSVLRTQGLLPAVVNYLASLLFINQTGMASLWYMPMILCVYLMLPVLSIAMKRIGTRYIAILCGFVLASGMVVPNINTTLAALGMGEETIKWGILQENLFSLYFLYVVAGYLIAREKWLDKIRKPYLLVCGPLAFLLTGLYQWWMYGAAIHYEIRYADLGILLSAACFFELLRRKEPFLPREGTKQRAFITWISKIAFALYFLHTNIMYVLNRYLQRTALNPFVKFFAVEIGGLALSAALIFVLSKIKFLRNRVFLIK